MARPANKSNAVRDALSANPDKPASQIAKELKVAPSLVYNVKSSMKRTTPAATAVGGRSGRKPGRKPGPKTGPQPARKAAPEAAHAALDSAFEFVTKVGGLLHAEQLLAKLRSIKDRL